MPGVRQGPVVIIEEIEVDEEVDALALALTLCPPGEAVEIHAKHCDVVACTCVPRVIVKPHAS